MQIANASAQHRAAITSLLQSQQLPYADLPPELSHFYTAVSEGSVVGLIGMEQYGSFGLLRSMVVHPAYRNQRIATKLVNVLEEKAAAAGVTDMYLLTETADAYFSNKGYRLLPREEVPEVIKQSSEFSHVCPASARVMKKELR